MDEYASGYLRELASQVIDYYDTIPLQNYDGFTEEEMHFIVNYPFEKECQICINTCFKKNILDNIPIFHIMKDLLNILKTSKNGLKLTAKGNLSLQVVNDIISRKHIPILYEGEYTKHIRSEEDYLPLHTTKIVLLMAGILRKTKSRLYLTLKTQKKLASNDYSDLFYEFIKAYTIQFNWGYNDNYKNDDIGQVGFIYLLYILQKYGKNYMDLTYFTNFYFKALPMLNIESQWDALSGFYKEAERIIFLRFFKRFARWFGFVDIKSKKENEAFNNSIQIRSTPVLSALINFERKLLLDYGFDLEKMKNVPIA